MPRFRTTLLVGGLLLVVCVFGTFWLSALPEMAAQRGGAARPSRAVVRVVRAKHRRRFHRPRPIRRAPVPVPTEVDVTPQPRYAPPPPYPTEALRTHRGGTVVLRVTVQSDGRVDAVRVMRSSGDPQLDRAAASTVSEWIFYPLPPGAAHSFDWPVRFTIDAR